MTPPAPAATSRSAAATSDSWTGTTIVCAANRATLHEASIASVEQGAVVVGVEIAAAVVDDDDGVELVTPDAAGCVEPEQAAPVAVMASAASASAVGRREDAKRLTSAGQ